MAQAEGEVTTPPDREKSTRTAARVIFNPKRYNGRFYALKYRENQATGFVMTASRLAASFSVSRAESARGIRKRNVVPTPSDDSNSTEP
jgi:hypothetical protein